jgi:hypothetical protein
VFQLEGDTWQQLGQSIESAEPDDGIGLSVVLSAWAKIVAAGAP